MNNQVGMALYLGTIGLNILAQAASGTHYFPMHKQYDAMLFPCLHDSGRNAAMEAIAHGLPVACLDLGDPLQSVSDDCGVIVEVDNSSIEQVISRLAKAKRFSNGILFRKLVNPVETSILDQEPG